MHKDHIIFLLFIGLAYLDNFVISQINNSNSIFYNNKSSKPLSMISKYNWISDSAPNLIEKADSFMKTSKVPYNFFQIKHFQQKLNESSNEYERYQENLLNLINPQLKIVHSCIYDSKKIKIKKNLKKISHVWKHLQKYHNNDKYDLRSANINELLLNNTRLHIQVNGNDFNDSNGTSAEALSSKIQLFRKGCPKCSLKRPIQHITEEQLTKLRIEFVKHQILEKLRLKERPNVLATGLPKPLYEGSAIEDLNEVIKLKDYDDYYAKTNKKFIFLKKETKECKPSGSPFMCFSFKINDVDVDGYDVNTAVLWIFKSKQKNANITMLTQQTIVVSELEQQKQSQYLPIARTIAIQPIVVEDEWVKIDIEWPIKRWFGNHDLSHLIQITCQSCDIQSMDEIISVDKDYRPFIMINTQNKSINRQRRNINCSDGVLGCCREKLYISFKDIGWSDWIIHPPGYDAYFCRGSCVSVASITLSTSQHSNILQKVIYASKDAEKKKRFELTPCCTAKLYSSLQLVYMDSNNTATQKTFPNMVVESCGCR